MQYLSCLERHIVEGDNPVRGTVHRSRCVFYESGWLVIQPKIGGKLHLKLNIGTRPIANKYREGKMKSTLKRKLIVRETVRREAHGISNALSRFRRSVLKTVVLRIRMDRWRLSFSTVCRISRQCASTGIGTG